MAVSWVAVLALIAGQREAIELPSFDGEIATWEKFLVGVNGRRVDEMHKAACILKMCCVE